MSIHKSYFNRNNTIISSGSTNTGLNPVTELFFGRTDNVLSTPGFSRFIFDIDLSQLQQKINDLVASSEYLQKSQQAKLAKAKGIEPAAEPEEEPLDEWVIGKMQYYAGIKP